MDEVIVPHGYSAFSSPPHLRQRPVKEMDARAFVTTQKILYMEGTQLRQNGTKNYKLQLQCIQFVISPILLHFVEKYQSDMHLIYRVNLSRARHLSTTRLLAIYNQHLTLSFKEAIRRISSHATAMRSKSHIRSYFYDGAASSCGDRSSQQPLTRASDDPPCTKCAGFEIHHARQ